MVQGRVTFQPWTRRERREKKVVWFRAFPASHSFCADNVRTQCLTMVSSIYVLLGAAIAWGVYTIVSGLRSNIEKARRSNLPYLVVRKSTFDQKEGVLPRSPESHGSHMFLITQRYIPTAGFGSSRGYLLCLSSSDSRNHGWITRYCKI